MHHSSLEYALLRDLWVFADIVLAELAAVSAKPTLIGTLRSQQRAIDARAVAILGVEARLQTKESA